MGNIEFQAIKGRGDRGDALGLVEVEVEAEVMIPVAVVTVIVAVDREVAVIAAVTVILSVQVLRNLIQEKTRGEKEERNQELNLHFACFVFFLGLFCGNVR